jgi:GntR family transcriptional repressor for pyruvate dehydrogenase complex
MSLALPPPRRRPRSLALELVDGLSESIRDDRLRPGDKLPTEAAIMVEYGVSRTVVREAISKLQAAGLVATRHGVGTFVQALGPVASELAGFRIAPEQYATLRDVVAVLELRIGVETEAAGLAAQRRTAQDLVAMRLALDTLSAAMARGADAVAADFQFHLEIARATQNPHFVQLMGSLGPVLISRARLAPGAPAGSGQAAGVLGRALAGPDSEPRAYLRRVHAEHESILDAIGAQDTEAARAAMRTHLANSRERRRKAAVLLGPVA